jgi:hypothetical protein
VRASVPAAKPRDFLLESTDERVLKSRKPPSHRKTYLRAIPQADSDRYPLEVSKIIQGRIRMLTNVDQVVTEKTRRIVRLQEELEICKVVIEEKMSEVIQLEQEILLLKEFPSDAN